MQALSIGATRTALFLAVTEAAAGLSPALLSATENPASARHTVQIPSWNWDGAYIGANAGYSWGPWDSSSLSAIFPSGSSFSTKGDPDVDGWLGGGQIGKNWMRGRWLYGIEGDWQWTDEKDKDGLGPVLLINTINVDGNGVIINQTTNLDWRLNWLATLRARFGYTAETWLLYVTGGLAFGEADLSLTQTLNAAIFQTFIQTGSLSSSLGLSDSTTRAGWTVGAGAEKAISERWTAKLEYLFVDLGSGKFFSNTGLDTKVELEDHILRVGLNRKFGGEKRTGN